MAQKSQLYLLQELAQTELDKALEKLGNARKNYIAGEKKLLDLIQYKEDYGVQLSQMLKQGINSNTWTNFERFIASMDKAITHQREHLIELDNHVQAAIKLWQEKKQKLNSFEVLIKRHEQKLENIEIKKEQKLMDEYGSRANRSNW